MPADSYDARLLDLLGETEQGGFDDAYGGAAPATLGSDALRAKKLQAQRAEESRLAGVPYGTPVSAGGTAGQYEVTNQNMGTQANPYSQTQVRMVGAPAVATGAKGGLNSLNSPPSDITESTQAANEQARSDRGNALQDVIDRFDAIKPDTGLADQSRRTQQEAVDLNRQLFDKANSYDPKAAASRFSEESLASALAIARSAPGAQSRESALFNALESLPALQAEGQRQANAEGRTQQGVALQAAGQLGQQATATRSADEQRTETFASLGLDVAQNISNAVGHDLDLDQRDREFLGEVALAVARLNLDTEHMTIDQQEAELNRALAYEGLDQEWRIFKQSGKITDRDILGGIFSLGGAAISGLASGKAAGK